MSAGRDTHDLVRRRYGEVAATASRCCPTAKDKSGCPPPADAPAVPEADLGLSCGEPVAFAHLNPGDVVLDLGSGAGRDVFLAAERVGPTGRVIGVDMTPEMLDLASRHAERFTARTGLANVEFREGQIEHLPLEDGSVDVVISNCVINLSPDKPRVFREAWRVLRPGGRLIVSDIVLERDLPQAAREDPDLYVACLAGAMRRDDYLQAIREAGFGRVEVLTERRFPSSDAGSDPRVEGAASSITVLAVKPGACCCGD